MTKGFVSFVVLNWNGIDDTLLCLDSIRKQTVTHFEIIVVDNGSEEEQKNTLRQLEDIVLVDLPKNTGFTGGQIAGYKQAKGEFLALINNDAVIAPDWAAEGLQRFQDHENAAVVGGKAFRWDDSGEQEPYDTSNQFYSYQVVNLITAHARTLTYGDTEAPVDSISGSGVMIRRQAIEKVGYFDNSFFAYYEETDLFARFKRAGMSILYDPHMHTWHKIARSTSSKPDFYLYYMHRNRFAYAIKNFDTAFVFSFLRSYIKDWWRSLAKVIVRGRQNSIEEKNIVRAGLRNLIYAMPLFIKRRSVMRLGKSYSEKLLKDKAESITVIIACYNYADYVSGAITSVLNQTLPPDEIIVINDGSTDDSLKVISSFKDRVKVVNQKNTGVIATKNRGLQAAQGDWVIFLDADDELHKTYIEELYADARRHNADVIYSGMQFTGADNNTFPSRPFTLRSLRHGNYINNSALMRRELLLAIGGYKQAMHFGYEDWELYVALAEQRVRFRHVRKPLLYYRRHETGSRDLNALNKLDHAHKVIRDLHPRLFSLKNRVKDFLDTLLTFHQRRTPLQLIKDTRYLFIKRMDKLSESSRFINKLMGASRLLVSGNFRSIADKIKLNVKRLFGKAA